MISVVLSLLRSGASGEDGGNVFAIVMMLSAVTFSR